jgi:N-acetylmuramoyl-L-alanine amidase
MFIAIHLNSTTSTSVKGSSVYYYKNYSGPFAKCISTSLPNAVRNGVGYGLENDGCHFYPFRVTRIETCPSVLVEVGYISNASERAMMNTANGQKYIAKGIYDGIVNYANM